MHEANRECIWLRSIIKYIWKLSKLSSIKDNSKLLHKDNIIYIAQNKEGYIYIYIYNVTKLSISPQTSTLIKSKRMVELVYNRFNHVIIYQIY